MAAACSQAERDVNAVTLLAVSKTFGPEAVADALAAGQSAFGENYIQEGVEKILALRASHPQAALQWHCIGPVQSNKTRLVAAHFDWVQSLDRLKIAQRLSEQRPADLPPLQVCLQVNVDGGANKAGVEPDGLLALAQAVADLPRLRLRGLMCIPEPAEGFEAQRALFARAKGLFDDLNARGFGLDTLSMGMSDDLDAAIAAGSTMVRVGRAVFGHRPRKDALTSSASGPA
jgi:pyridoxal phosphate enzyme (YggS family)